MTHTHIALLGRQPALGMAELEQLYGATATAWWSDNVAQVTAEGLAIDRLGGSQKLGRIVLRTPERSWPAVARQVADHYSHHWAGANHKITLGISALGFPPTVDRRAVQRVGLTIKARLKRTGTSLRLVPNQGPGLNTATAHHNRLGLSAHKVELLILRGPTGTLVAESIGAQNITALARRDQARPRTDAFVGMLPPKLARMMINLTGPHPTTPRPLILDPFCGTGTVLQEALLLGMDTHGTDLADKMVHYSRDNLTWLTRSHRLGTAQWQVAQADATTASWHPAPTAVVCETYLGQPFSAPPAPAKLRQVVGTCNRIISHFLANLAPQLTPGTPLCIAVPAWRDHDGHLTQLPVVDQVVALGYRPVSLRHVPADQLLYYRPDQVVARRLLLLQAA